MGRDKIFYSSKIEKKREIIFSENTCLLRAVCSKVLERVLRGREQGPCVMGKPSRDAFPNI